MAGDWIKMRIDLQSHPKIVRILSAMKRKDVQFLSDKFRVIGGLHAVWSVFDIHSVNGELHGYTPETMDHVIGLDGFADAMIDVGWMSYDGKETLTMPEFFEHNGQSAKRRAEDQKRKRDSRKSSSKSPEDFGQKADKKRTREEKRREYINTEEADANAPDYSDPRKFCFDIGIKLMGEKKRSLIGRMINKYDVDLVADVIAEMDARELAAEGELAGYFTKACEGVAKRREIPDDGPHYTVVN